MTTRGFLLYQLTAKARTAHADGHSGIDCNVPDEIDEYLGEPHNRHPEFYDWHAEYLALVAQPVTESPVCPKCGNVHPVTMWIPGRAMGGTWVRGTTIKECGHCGHRLSYSPDRD